MNYNKGRLILRKKTIKASKNHLKFWKGILKGKFKMFLKKNPKGRGLY